MRGIILAAGSGTRMGKLTESLPKALLKFGDKYLIEYSIDSLIKAGVKDIVINACHHGNKIINALGYGEKYGINIAYSKEETALETGGGIFKALPLLGREPFIALSCDVVTDFDIASLPKEPKGLAHIILVDTPSYKETGDFNLEKGYINNNAPCNKTYANIGVYRNEFFKGCKLEKFMLGTLLRANCQNKLVTGEYYKGLWENIGTKEQLKSFKKFVTI